MALAPREVPTNGAVPVPRPKPLVLAPLVAAPAQPPSLVEYGVRRWLVVTGVMLAALLFTIDLTIVNVALPTIQGNLGTSVDEGTWVVTAYVIANVVVIPMTPWLQLRLGRKNYFLISVAGFTVASVLCGLANSLWMLVAFRIVQGAFGGGLLATAQVIMRETFPPEELGMSQSIFALGTVLGPSIGPTIGGVLVDNFAWPWIFDVNIVPGVVAFFLIWRYLRDNAKPRPAPIDLPGIGLLVVAVSTMQYVLDQGQLADWFNDSVIVTCTAIAALATVAFVWWELRAATPIVDLRVLAQPAVALALGIAGVFSVVIFPSLLLLPQFTENTLGFTSTDAGLLIGTRALMVVLLTIPIARLTGIARFDLRWAIGGGLVLCGIGTLWLAAVITPNTAMEAFVVPLLLIGSGGALVYSPLLTATMRIVAPEAAAKAASFIVLSFQLGGSVSSASIVAFLDQRLQLHQALLAGELTLSRAPVAQFLQHGTREQLAALLGAQASALSYADAFCVVGVLALVVTPGTLLLARKRT